MNVRKREMLGGGLFFLFAATYFVTALDIKQFNDGFLSSDFIPKAYGLILMLLSITQIVIGVYGNKKGMSKQNSGVSLLKQLAPVISTFALLIAYIVFLKPIGFVIMSSIFVFFMTLMLSSREERTFKRLLITAIVACTFSTAVYLLFVRGFALTLPAGILG